MLAIGIGIVVKSCASNDSNCLLTAAALISCNLLGSYMQVLPNQSMSLLLTIHNYCK